MLQPLRSDVLVKLDGRRTMSPGGIHIPDTAQEQPVTGEVIAVGPEQQDIKAGDRVLMGKYNGTVVDTGEDGEYRVCTTTARKDSGGTVFQPDVYGVLEP